MNIYEKYTQLYIRKAVQMQKNVLKYLEESARKTPEKIIFADNENQVSYEEFTRQSKSLGTCIVNGVKGKNAPIVVLIEKKITSLIAFFGVIYSGNFYVPVDYQMPAKRIETIFETLMPQAVIVTENTKSIIDKLSFECKVIQLESSINKDVEEKRLEEIHSKMIDTDPLYAIFTSGSTGVPKGVVVNHRSVIDLIDHFAEIFQFNEDCIFGNQAPFDFDVSVKDIYSTIKNGGTMYIIPKVMFSFPAKLITYLNEKKINTVIWATSALRIVQNLNAFTGEIPKYLRRVMFSGEVMSNKVLNYWRAYIPDAMYVNLYGPTEITCNCTYYIVEDEFQDDEVLPIGKAFDNTDILVLDEKREKEVSFGEIGELCVRGTSLALGYYNNIEKTKEAFCQNPQNSMYPELIYCTGDLVKYDNKGNLLFVSRKDHQIKHMGHRIELGEIEVAVNALPFVDSACCIYDEMNEKIVLFYQAEEKCHRELLKSLGQTLPKYMFPNRLEHFERLPLNKNAKIDRALLKEKYIDL